MSADPSATTLSDTIAAWLRDHGVSPVFTLPGSSCLSLIDALHRAETAVLLCRDEGTAMHAANAAGACAGTFGCALLSRGPGALSGMCGLVTACDGDPVLLICGDNARPFRGRGVVTQDAPLKEIFAPAAPTFVVTDAGSCLAALGKLEDVLLIDRRSAVLILPSDVQNLPASAGRGWQPAHPVAAEGRDVSASTLLDRLRAARRPFVIWGERIARDAGWRLLAERVLGASPGLDSAVTMRGLSRMPTGVRGIVGTQGHPEVNALLDDSDLVVIVGERLGAVSTGAPELFAAGRPILSFALFGDEQDYVVPSYEAVLSRDGMRAQLSALVKGGGIAGSTGWRPPVADAPTLLVDLLRMLPPNIAATLDSGQNFFWAAHALAASPPRPVFYSERQGTMGFAIPAAIGVTSATGDPVLAIVGDGGFLMRLGELHTIAELALPVTVLVVDNEGLGMVRRTQVDRGLADIATALPAVPILKVAQAFGLSAADLSPENCRSISVSDHRTPTILRLPVPATTALASRGGPAAALPGTQGTRS